MLLEGVAFPRHIGRYLASIGQPHTHTLPIGRVRLLWFLNQSLQDHALDLGLLESDMYSLSLFIWAFSEHLQQCRPQVGSGGDVTGCAGGE